MAQTKRPIPPELLQAAKTDPILDHMIRHNLPLNRQTWIDVNYGGEPPDPWTAEDEAEVPEPLQRSMTPPRKSPCDHFASAPVS